jgi:hypothetical protein
MLTTVFAGILDELLEKQIVQEMRKQGNRPTNWPRMIQLTNIQVEQEIESQIDEIVKEQVEECLKTYIPKELQDELAVSKRELEELNLRLHNS